MLALVAALVGGLLAFALYEVVTEWLGMDDDPSLWQRLVILVVSLLLLLVGFVVVVEARCAVGWIDEDECIL